MLSPRKPRFLLLGLLVLAACGGETADERPPPELTGSPAILSFEAIAYVDPSASNARIHELLRAETSSVFYALRTQQIEINRKRQVDVDVRHVFRDPVTLVDTASGTRRPALRVRYWFVGVTRVPNELLTQGGLPFAMLATDDQSQVEKLGPCLVERKSDKPLAQLFDPTPKPCEQMIRAEQHEVDAARAALRAPSQEIVPAEHDRLTLPITLYLKPLGGRTAKSDLDAGAPSTGTPTEQPSSAVAGAPHEGPSSGQQSERGAISVPDKLRERERAEDEAEEEIRKGGGPALIAPPSQNRPAQSGGYSVIPEPNVFLLWALGIIVVLVGANEFRRRGIGSSSSRRRR